jgi:glycerate 2-kinase
MQPSLTDPASLLKHLFQIAVARALPGEILAQYLPAPPKGRTVVIGAGKAAGSMALAIERAIDEAWPRSAAVSGLMITRYHHTPPAYEQFKNELATRGRQPRIELLEAAHPVPDQAGLDASRRLMHTVQGLSADDLVICLISGGGSALLTQPIAGMSLAEKQAINAALLKSGANIGEMNCVRKHLSVVKGGRLAALCAPAAVLTLAISDVPGDDPSVIASGPTVPDETSCADALAILDRYALKLPTPIHTQLRNASLETPKPGDPLFSNCRTELIATPQQSLQAAATAARQLGVAAYILSDEIQGEARDIGFMHAALAKQIARHNQPFTKPCVVLSGGETTVTVRSAHGRGGRAVEFLLAVTLELAGQAKVWALSADTDGIDGTEDHAGAVCDPTSLSRARSLGVSAQAALDANNAYAFFDSLGDLLVTGPTYTNVNDFRALLIL